MSYIKKVDGATHTAVTMGGVKSASVNYNGIFVTTYAAGSYSPSRDLRGVEASAAVSYLEPGTPAALDASPADLVITCTDQANGTIVVTCPGFKPAGNSFEFGETDYTSQVQQFTLAPGAGESVADMAPTVA